MEEIWKDIYYIDCLTKEIVDYRGLYQVSNLGNIKNILNNNILKGDSSSKYGHTRVYLYKNKKRNRYLKHRIVAHMFLELVDNKLYIDHIDTNPLNNNVNNLRWTTLEENNNNPLTKEKHTGSKNSQFGKTGRKNKKSIKIICVDLNTKEIIIFDGMRDAERNGFEHSSVSRSCKNNKPYKNKLWYYLKDYLNTATLSEADLETDGTCND